MSKKEVRPRITEEEYELVKGIRSAGKEHGVGLQNLDHGWLKSKDTSIHFKNPFYKTPEVYKFEKLQKELIKDLQNYSPKFPELKRIKNEEGYCLVIDPADIHIGKLCTAFETGTEYNQQIAVKRVK